MSTSKNQNTKAYNTNFVANPSLRCRHRRRRNAAEEDCTLNDDYNLLLQPSSVQCPPLTGPHIETANKHVQNGSYSSPLDHEDISIAVENAVLSIVKNEPVSPETRNNHTDTDVDEQDGRRRRKYGSLYNNGEVHCEQTLAAASNQEEVTRAARSLFSKRTRTLYNWLSPGISKSRLKTAVSAAWDRLPTVEKDFYISQVLGRFGVPSVRVMVNPQIVGFSCTPSSSRVPEVTAIEHHNDNSNSNSSNTNNCNNIMDAVNSMNKRKRQRVHHRSPSSIDDTVQGEDDDKIIVKQIQDEPLHEFVDDPELHKEFEQFKWALHVSNVHD